MRKRLFLLAALIVTLCGQTTAQTVEQVKIEGAVGKLAATVHRPALKNGEKCPVVIICHGFGGNKESALLIALADSLQAEGVAAVRFDFNGHGGSEGEFVNMTVPNEITDAKCVYRYATALPYVDATKVGFAGHSQGGVVAGMTAGELGSRVSAVALMAPAAVLRDDAIRGNTFGSTYNPLDPPEYVELPGGRKLGREYIKTAFSLPIYETSARYHGAACMIHGTGDRIAPYSYSERYNDIWPGGELHLLDGADHGFSGLTATVAGTAARFFARHLK